VSDTGPMTPDRATGPSAPGRAANEKGGVVRRPFSVLRTGLIAVSPQSGVAWLIGSPGSRLEERGTGGVAATPPPVRAGSFGSGAARVAFASRRLSRAAAASPPAVSEPSMRRSPGRGVTRTRLTVPPDGVDEAT